MPGETERRQTESLFARLVGEQGSPTDSKVAGWCDEWPDHAEGLRELAAGWQHLAGFLGQGRLAFGTDRAAGPRRRDRRRRLEHRLRPAAEPPAVATDAAAAARVALPDGRADRRDSDEPGRQGLGHRPASDPGAQVAAGRGRRGRHPEGIAPRSLPAGGADHRPARPPGHPADPRALSRRERRAVLRDAVGARPGIRRGDRGDPRRRFGVADGEGALACWCGSARRSASPTTATCCTAT